MGIACVLGVCYRSVLARRLTDSRGRKVRNNGRAKNLSTRETGQDKGAPLLLVQQ